MITCACNEPTLASNICSLIDVVKVVVLFAFCFHQTRSCQGQSFYLQFYSFGLEEVPGEVCLPSIYLLPLLALA